MPGNSFMDGLRAVRQEYRPRWRAAQGADQVDDGRRIIAAMKAAVVAARPEQSGRGYSFEQGSTGGREAIITAAVQAADAALGETVPRQFWAAGDAVFTLISGPVDREDRRAGRLPEE